MAIDEGQRLRLLNRLHAVLGTAEADTLMSYLPASGASELSTRGDMADLRTELKTEMADLRTELKTEVADLRTELRTGIADLRADLHREITAGTRTMIIGVGGLMTAWGGAVIAAGRIH